MLSAKKNPLPKVFKLLPLFSLLILLTGIVISLSKPPQIYSQVINAWNLQRDGSNNLNFFYLPGGVNPALQLKTDGTLNVNKISESARPDFYIQLSGTSQFNTLQANSVLFDQLTLNRLDAQIFYDSNDTRFFVDPASTSAVNALYRSYGFAGPEYDANQTDFYVDPSGTSQFNTLQANSVLFDQLTLNRLYSQIFYDSNDTRFYVDPAYVSAVNHLYRSYGFAGPEYDANQTDFYVDPSGTSQFNTLQANSVLFDRLTLNRLDTQIFYDSNNTNFFVDPTGTSAVNALYRSYGFAGPEYDANNTGYYVDPNGQSVVNLLYGADIRPQVMRDWNNTNYYIDMDQTSSFNQAYISDLRAQIFYDSNDTRFYVDPAYVSAVNFLYRSYGFAGPEYDANDPGFYVDPNGTSRMNYTINNNAYAYGWMQASIFYDANNNGYYVDPDATSSLNSVHVNNIYLRYIGWISDILNQSVAVNSSPTFYRPTMSNFWCTDCGDFITSWVFNNFQPRSSDSRLKTNINNLTDDISEKIDLLQPVSFEWNEKSEDFGINQPDGIHYGLVAQDVEKVFPGIVDANNKGYKTINYNELTSLLLKQVQDLKKQNQELEDQAENQKIINDKQNEEITQLKVEIKQLKQTLNEFLDAN